MKANSKRVPTRFAPETWFEVSPAVLAPFRVAKEEQFERLKDRLLRERLEAVVEPEVNCQLRRAANEAAALAWVTPYPLFVFPALFEEKAEAALRRADPERVCQSNQEFLAV